MGGRFDAGSQRSDNSVTHAPRASPVDRSVVLIAQGQDVAKKRVWLLLLTTVPSVMTSSGKYLSRKRSSKCCQNLQNMWKQLT